MKIVRFITPVVLAVLSACASTPKPSFDQIAPTIPLVQPVQITFNVIDSRATVASRGLAPNHAGQVTGVSFGMDVPTPDQSPVADYVRRFLETGYRKSAPSGAGQQPVTAKVVTLTLKYFEWASRPDGATMRYDVEAEVSASGTPPWKKTYRDEYAMKFSEPNMPALWVSDFLYPPVLQRILSDREFVDALQR